MIEDQPWFVAADILNALGYPATSHSQIASKLSADEVIVKQIHKGVRSVRLVRESGLYALINRSDKPQAKPFQDWVNNDVLPAIRKDGAYIQGEEKVASGELSEDEFVLRAISILQAKVDRLKQERDAAVEKQDDMRVVMGVAEHSLSRCARTLPPDVNMPLVKRSLMQSGYLHRKQGDMRAAA